MTSYLVEAILLVALLVTAVRVTQMQRDLKKLRRAQADFCSTLGEAASAFDTIVRTVNDLNCNGTHLIHLLGVKIDEARRLMADVDRQIVRSVRGQSPQSSNRTDDAQLLREGALRQA
jgi:hypothetical protein